MLLGHVNGDEPGTRRSVVLDSEGYAAVAQQFVSRGIALVRYDVSHVISVRDYASEHPGIVFRAREQCRQRQPHCLLNRGESVHFQMCLIHLCDVAVLVDPVYLSFYR